MSRYVLRNVKRKVTEENWHIERKLKDDQCYFSEAVAGSAPEAVEWLAKLRKEYKAFGVKHARYRISLERTTVETAFLRRVK